MKKIVLIAGIASSIQLAYSQKNVMSEPPTYLFTEGKSMFLNKNYTGAENLLSEFKKETKNTDLESEADFMIAASSFFRGKDYSTEILYQFLETHPESYHKNDITFYLGSTFFEKQDWNKALFWFNQADVTLLNLEDQDDYMFRVAFANLQEGNKDESFRLFDILAKNSNKYYEPATYYKAYIDFYNGNLDKSLPIFESLKNKPEYKEQASFFLIQGDFLKNNLQETITNGTDFIKIYPNNSNSTEVLRILGNSNYRLSNLDESIFYYDQYIEQEPSPLKEDAFLLGSAYTKKGLSLKAIDALQLSASKEDKIGQASYMLLGQNYLATNDNANALMAFDAASRVSFDPAISELSLYNYAMLTQKTSLSLFDQSITVLQRFLNEYPSSKYADEVNKQLATALLSTKNYQAVLDVINQMHSPGKQVLEAKQTILYQLGIQDFIDGQYNSAIQQFKACIQMGNLDLKAKTESYYWKGESNYQLNNYQAAIQDFREYLNLSNSSSENYNTALYNLGYSYFKEKQYSNSLNAFQKYVAQEKNKSNNSYADAWNRIGDANLYARNFSGAAQAYNNASANNQQSAEYADFQKAFVLGLMHDYNGKINALDAMIRKYPNSEYVDDAMYEKSRALVMLGKEQEATTVLSQMLNKYPNSDISAKAGVLLGQSYYNNNQSAQAISAYKKVISENKNSEEARIALQSLEGIYRDLNDISSYANYANSLGSGIIISSSRQDTLSYLAAENVYLKKGGKDAILAMNQYIQQNSNGQFVGDAHFYLGEIAMNSNDNITALSEFKKTVEYGGSKNRSKALLNIGDISLSNNDSESAYKAFKQMRSIASNLDEKNAALLGIIKSSATVGNNDEIISVASELLQSEKSAPEAAREAYVARAKAYLNKGNSNKAIEDLTKAGTDTRSIYGAEAQYLLADTYLKGKSYDKAEKQVQSFMKEGSPHSYWVARSILVLSDTYKAKGDKFQAKQYLESLDANYTGDEAEIKALIQEKLESLKQ